jgi:hypothetical protein
MKAAEVFFMFFTDLHVQLLSRGILEPGEQLVGQTVTSYIPWWAMGLIQRQYLVLATDRRLVLVDHRLQFFPAAQKLHAVDSILWQNVQEVKVKGLFMKKKLSIRGQGERGPVSLTAVIPNGFFGLLAPMKDNMNGARAVAQAHAGRAQALGQGGYQQPMSFAPPPPAPQLAAYSQPPMMPAQNAPGYQSAPPPAPNPFAAAPYGAPPPQAGPGYPPRSWS